MGVDFPDYASQSQSAQQLMGSVPAGAGITSLPLPVGTHSILILAAGATIPTLVHTQPSNVGLVPQFMNSGAGSAALYVAGPMPSGTETSLDVPQLAGTPQTVIAILDPLFVAAQITNTVTVSTGGGAQVLQTELKLVGGALISLGRQLAAASLPVVVNSEQLGQKAMAASMAVAIASDQSALPVNFGATAQAFTNASRGVGTYTFTLPAASVGKGLIVRTFNSAGTTGTTAPSIGENDQLGPGNFTILAGAALAVGASSRLRVYPGLVAAANVVANDLIGQGAAANIQVVVATATTTFVQSYSATQ